MKFLNPALQKLAPYVPGEQPKAQSQVIKLNTNENPYPPSPQTAAAVSATINQLQLYADPTCADLTKALADYFEVTSENIFLGNGSDEVLAFCFQSLMGAGVAFPDLTYGFYPIFAQVYGIETSVVPLDAQMAIDLDDYQEGPGTIIFANPNAPTGQNLPASTILDFAKVNPERLVIVDEAYVDYGGESLVPYVNQYDNLLVVGTFSKAWQLAGARLGYAVGNPQLISELMKVKFSFNPYSINAMTNAAGLAAIADLDYHEECLEKVLATRKWTLAKLQGLGFEVSDSHTNFLFAQHPKAAGERLYQQLKEQDILVRWFNQARIKNYIRISIGTDQEMAELIGALAKLLEEV